MERYLSIERSLITTYRSNIWRKFTSAINEYDLIKEGDKIAVCISGGKDSMLMAKCMQELHKHSKYKFEVVYLVMDPGYNEINRQAIENNALLLNIPVQIFNSDIFSVVADIEESPCYLCARMRRGFLYNKAKELGCNKIALGHHFDDVIETILMGLFYNGQIQTMMPKLRSKNFPDMELIRPMYQVKESDIINWKNHNDLQFIQCACRFTENCSICDNGGGGSKRQEMKNLVKKLRLTNPNADLSIFKSVYNINMNCIIGYKKGDTKFNFLDGYENSQSEE